MNILDFKNSEIFVDILVCRHHRNFWDFGTHFLTFWYWVIFSDILVLPEQKNLEDLKIFLTFWYVTNHFSTRNHLLLCGITYDEVNIRFRSPSVTAEVTSVPKIEPTFDPWWIFDSKWSCINLVSEKMSLWLYFKMTITIGAENGFREPVGIKWKRNQGHRRSFQVPNNRKPSAMITLDSNHRPWITCYLKA